jgi:hypothetical protein
MTINELENRVAVLERKLVEMQLQLDSMAGKKNHPNPHGAWWVETAGRFKNDPVFEEIVRLGREYRKSQLPDYMKKKRPIKKKKHART